MLLLYKKHLYIFREKQRSENDIVLTFSIVSSFCYALRVIVHCQYFFVFDQKNSFLKISLWLKMNWWSLKTC